MFSEEVGRAGVGVIQGIGYGEREDSGVGRSGTK